MTPITMLDECVAIINRLPVSPSEYDTHDDWCQWLERHSIDPNRVVISGFIRRDPERRRVYYETWKVDDAGKPVVVDTPRGPDSVYVVDWVQLEAEPMPFPEVDNPATRRADPGSAGQ